MKTGVHDSLQMFQAEADGLRELASAHVIRVPEVIEVAANENGASITMEWLDLSRGTAETERTLGRQMAALHRVTQRRFGWHRDNTIGLTLQENPYTDNWIDFYCEHRVASQLRLAADNGFNGALLSSGNDVINSIERYFDGYDPLASLLHGDLWGGNWGCCHGQPVIFDPAVYFGDRETDLAMTRLFGGFGADFYAAYEESWPLEDGHDLRCALYQLYHVLNHLNLFGGGYLAQAMALMDRLLR